MIRASFFISKKPFFSYHCEVSLPCQILTQRATRAFICNHLFTTGPNSDSTDRPHPRNYRKMAQVFLVIEKKQSWHSCPVSTEIQYSVI